MISLFYFLSYRRRRCSYHSLPMKRNRKSSPENLPPMKLFRNSKKRKKRTSFKSPQQLVQEETCSYLPDDCWEIVFRFLIINDNYNNRHHCLNSLSLVSKQFLSVTNGLLFSLTISYQTRPFLDRLFERFTNLNSLNITRYNCDLDMLLCKIPRFPLNITSLKISNNHTNSIHSLLSKFQSLQHLDLECNDFLNDKHVAKLSLFLVDLVSINLNLCSDLTELSLFILVRNCPSLSEIKMKSTSIGEETSENNDSLTDIGVYPRLKSLYLGSNIWYNVEKIIMFGSSFPNLELLDLTSSDWISNDIWQVIRRFYMITHLSLDRCTSNVDIFEMNFVLPKLEVLDFTDTDVHDETLHAISKSCPELLELSLVGCYYVTEKGVKDVVENCKQLKEILLEYNRISDEIRELAMDAYFSSVLKLI
jgi:hypothetical protein